MTPLLRERLLRSLRLWCASFVVVAGFLYYKSSATLGAVLLAGLLTLLLSLWRAWTTRAPF